jgi:hypothetical protein
VTAVEAHGAHLDRQPPAAGIEQDDRKVDVLAPDHVFRERVLCAARLLGRHHRGELAAADVSDEADGSRVEPADDPVLVDHVARDLYALEGVLHVAAELTELRHGRIVA